MKIGNRIVTKDLFGRRVELTPAVEAPVPDLTRTTSNMMRKAAGSRQDTGTAAEPATTSEETRQADGANVDPDAMSDNTDNIMNTPEGGRENPPDGLDESSEQPQDGLPPDEGDDMMGGDDMGGGDDMMGGEGGDAWTKEQARSISKLHGRLFMLYQSAVTLNESLSDYCAPSATQELRTIFNSASGHLSSLIETCSDILSTPFTVENYPEKLKKYVALRNLYNIINQMLKLHFDAVNVENKQPS